MLALTYRFRGTLKNTEPVEPLSGASTLSLTPAAPVSSSHVACLTSGKGKAVRWDTLPDSCNSAPLAPRQVILKKSGSSKRSKIVKSPANHKSVLISKSPVMKKSIIIQHSSKPPVQIVPKPAVRSSNTYKPHHVSILPRPNTQDNAKQTSRVILPIRPLKGGPKRDAIVVKQPNTIRNKAGDNKTKGSVVKLQRAVRPR